MEDAAEGKRPSAALATGDLLQLFGLLQKDLQDSTRNSAILTELGKDLRDVALEVADLGRRIKGDGNGDRGLSWRLMRLEETVVGIDKRVESIDRRDLARGAESEKGQWGLKQTALAGGIAFLTAFIVKFLDWLMASGGKHP